MRFYTKQHKAYCGIDLHARKHVHVYPQPDHARSSSQYENQSRDVFAGHYALS